MEIDGGRGWLGDPGAGNPAHLQKKKSSMSFHLSIGTYINVEVIIRGVCRPLARVLWPLVPHPGTPAPLQARPHRPLVGFSWPLVGVFGPLVGMLRPLDGMALAAGRAPWLLVEMFWPLVGMLQPLVGMFRQPRLFERSAS